MVHSDNAPQDTDDIIGHFVVGSHHSPSCLGLVNPHVGDWGNETVGTGEISRANMSLPEL